VDSKKRAPMRVGARKMFRLFKNKTVSIIIVSPKTNQSYGIAS